jgi:hypothetical protein
VYPSGWIEKSGIIRSAVDDPIDDDGVVNDPVYANIIAGHDPTVFHRSKDGVRMQGTEMGISLQVLHRLKNLIGDPFCGVGSNQLQIIIRYFVQILHSSRKKL